MRHWKQYVLGLALVASMIGATAGTANAASTRVNLTLTCDRDFDGTAFVQLRVIHTNGLAGSISLECGALAGRSDRDPQITSGVPSGIRVETAWVQAGGVTTMGLPADYDLVAKVRFEDSATGLGATLVAR